MRADSAMVLGGMQGGTHSEGRGEGRRGRRQRQMRGKIGENQWEMAKALLDGGEGRCCCSGTGSGAPLCCWLGRAVRCWLHQDAVGGYLGAISLLHFN